MNRRLCFLSSVVLVLVLVSSTSAILVARYEFEGTFDDTTGNGHDGTPINDASIVGWLPEPQTGALSVHKAQMQYVEIPDDPAWDNLSDSFTVSAWINADDNSDRLGLVSWEYNMMRAFSFRVDSEGANKVVRLQVTDGGGGRQNMPGTTHLDVGTWYFLAATYQNIDAGTSEIKLFVNGALDASHTVALGPMATPDVPLHIGAYIWDPAGYQKYMDGLMDDVRIYDTALSEEEIAAMFVPEPATIALLGLGGLAVLGGRKRR